ncbi:ComEC/Rec2 family competence protein [Halarcobacter anaerophilus]|uniref:ComEC/Rec2 family competence protein n=1 Tax=Halarcobacter anaerophilus TaxID=877500 RepID=UPI000697E584|nr:ComEC/Rec2 family competence protein [Halarcobacter anaerophilus]
MNSLQFISSKKDFFLLFSILAFIAFFNFFHEYFKYKDLKEEELFQSRFQIINIYKKEDFYVLKLQNEDLTFFTSIEKNRTLQKLDFITLGFLTTGVNFYSYLKGFYAKSIYYEKEQENKSFKKMLNEKIKSQHKNIEIKQLFSALFLAIPISKEYRDIYTNFSISHLIAISGFHLSILASLVYVLLYYPYSFFQKRYFPYRNRKADILIFTLLTLFLYLLLTNLVASVLRSFIMFFLGTLFLRSNIKVFSFGTLFLTLILILSLFPKYLFSISLWFSICGVFYIFLYIHYFKNLPKIFSFIFFNFWIFFVFNPIVHFFFPNTAYEQLLSPFLTIFFTFFYPIELFLHFIGFGTFWDEYLISFINYEIEVFEVKTPYIFFIFYIIFSFLSVYSKRAFLGLNLLLIFFNLYMFMNSFL